MEAALYEIRDVRPKTAERLEALLSEVPMTTAQYAEAVGAGVSTVRPLLHKLREKGVVRRVEFRKMGSQGEFTEGWVKA